MSAHSPGPWALINKHPARTHVADAGGNTVIVGEMLIGRHEGNARLIAAAPEMYELLWEALDYLGWRLQNRALALIARIDGKEKP